MRGDNNLKIKAFDDEHLAYLRLAEAHLERDDSAA
jgi:hypothetical protein